MGMRSNWEQYVASTKAKSKSHLKAARYWSSVDTGLSLSLIFLGAITTFLALVKIVPNLLVAGVAAIATLVSAVSAFLRATDRKQLQLHSSQEFRGLMMKMVRCEDNDKYEELWKEYNKAISDEPFLPKRFVEDIEFDWTMTSELNSIAEEKDAADAKKDQKINDQRFKIPIDKNAYESL